MQNRLYRPNAANVAAEIIEGEAIIINVATGTYYNTEGIGGWIWERCVEGKDIDEIVTLGCGRFEVSSEQMAEDLQIFLEALKAEQLVVESAAVSADDIAVPTMREDRLIYQTPKLTAYRDLKDLLALDPPMPRLDL